MISKLCVCVQRLMRVHILITNTTSRVSIISNPATHFKASLPAATMHGIRELICHNSVIPTRLFEANAIHTWLVIRPHTLATLPRFQYSLIFNSYIGSECGNRENSFNCLWVTIERLLKIIERLSRLIERLLKRILNGFQSLLNGPSVPCAM